MVEREEAEAELCLPVALHASLTCWLRSKEAVGMQFFYGLTRRRVMLVQDCSGTEAQVEASRGEGR